MPTSCAGVSLARFMPTMDWLYRNALDIYCQTLDIFVDLNKAMILLSFSRFRPNPLDIFVEQAIFMPNRANLFFRQILNKIGNLQIFLFFLMFGTGHALYKNKRDKPMVYRRIGRLPWINQSHEIPEYAHYIGFRKSGQWRKLPDPWRKWKRPA